VSCLILTAQRYGYDFKLLKAVVEINDLQPKLFLDKMEQRLKGFDGKTVGILGLAFKPNTDDLRDAKSLQVIAALLSKGAQVKAYDPIAMENTRKIFPQITYCKNAYEAAEGAHCLAVVTEWNEFKLLDLDRLKEALAAPIIFDGRNIYDPQRMRRLGFDYHCIGRNTGGDGNKAQGGR